MNQTRLRQHYYYFNEIATRWMDNDVYGHVNNATYYSYFDTVVNNYLIQCGGLDIQRGDVVGFVVASSCEYYAPIAFPQAIEAAFRANKIGNTSVEYGVAIFVKGETTACACGTFTHVFVDRASNKSVAVPEPIRQALTVALGPDK